MCSIPVNTCLTRLPEEGGWRQRDRRYLVRGWGCSWLGSPCSPCTPRYGPHMSHPLSWCCRISSLPIMLVLLPQGSAHQSFTLSGFPAAGGAGVYYTAEVRDYLVTGIPRPLSCPLYTDPAFFFKEHEHQALSSRHCGYHLHFHTHPDQLQQAH